MDSVFLGMTILPFMRTRFWINPGNDCGVVPARPQEALVPVSVHETVRRMWFHVLSHLFDAFEGCPECVAIPSIYHTFVW